MKAMWLAAIAALCLGAGCVTPSGPGGIEQWNANHPEAAAELCRWVGNHQEASRLMFDWEAHHPGKAHELVDWTLANPGRGIDGFVQAHPGWEHFDWVTETHRPAANAFMDWIRRHPEAAQKLMNHPGGLQWAARHGGC